jgi:addiction module HigA family antidote
MPMKNPGHPGRQVKEELDFLNISVADAAEGLGVTRQQLYNVISGRSIITPDMAVRLEKGIGGTAEGWLKLQAAYDLAQARTRAEQITITRLVPKAAELTAPRV